MVNKLIGKLGSFSILNKHQQTTFYEDDEQHWLTSFFRNKYEITLRELAADKTNLQKQLDAKAEEAKQMSLAKEKLEKQTKSDDTSQVMLLLFIEIVLMKSLYITE